MIKRIETAYGIQYQVCDVLMCNLFKRKHEAHRYEKQNPKVFGVMRKK